MRAQNEPDADTLSAALAYARAGWPVFPLLAGEKRPATEHGFLDATTEPQRIVAWFAGRPSNVGIATGSPGPDVLDIDRHGDASGYPALRRLQHAGLTGKPLAVVRTPRGGAHL